MPLGPELRFLDRTKVLYEGKPYLFFGGTDYHRLASHPDVLRALREVADSDGLSCAGSRTTTGNHPLLVELERKVAAFLGAGEAALCSSGYLSNAVALETVAGEFQRFFIDGGAHSSLATPAGRLPREAIVTFRHADPEDLARELNGRLRPGEEASGPHGRRRAGGWGDAAAPSVLGGGAGLRRRTPRRRRPRDRRRGTEGTGEPRGGGAPDGSLHADRDPLEGARRLRGPGGGPRRPGGQESSRKPRHSSAQPRFRRHSPRPASGRWKSSRRAPG